MSDEVTPIPSAIAAVSTPSADSVAAGPGQLLDQHKRYAERFHEWLLKLNRHDFMQAKKVLDAMMHAYAKHTMKIHSPPAKKDNENAPGTTSEGSPDSGVPAPGDGNAA